MDWVDFLIIAGIISGSLVGLLVVVVGIFWAWLLWQIRKERKKMAATAERIRRGRE